MLGVYYLLSFVGLGIIIMWAINNDRLKPGEPTRGLLRMERDTPGKPAPKRQPSGVSVRRDLPSAP